MPVCGDDMDYSFLYLFYRRMAGYLEMTPVVDYICNVQNNVIRPR